MKANSEQTKENKKIVYAITFKDLPFPEIDKYVCVPYSWILYRYDAQKILAAYPKNEAPFVTRIRAKNREKFNGDWSLYEGFIKFQSENYEEVVQWIENMIAKGGDKQENKPEIQDPLAEPVGSRQLRTAKNPDLSGILPENPQLAVKPHDNPQRQLSKMLIRRPLPTESSKPTVSSANAPSNNQSGIQNIVNDHNKQDSVDTSAQSSPKPADGRQPSPKPADGRQHFNDSYVEIVVGSEPIKEERPSSSEQAQPDSALDHHFSLIESRLTEIHGGPQANDSLRTLLVQNSAAKPPSRANQPHDYAQPVRAPSSKSQLQGTTGNSSKPTHFVKTVPSTTHYAPTTIDLSSQRQIPAIRRKSSTAVNKTAGKRARIEIITNNIPTSQQSLYNQQPPNYPGNFGDQRHLQSINTSAAQNLSHSQTLQQIARMQDIINQPNMPSFDQRNYAPYQNPLPGYVPCQPNHINPNKYLPRQNQQPMVSTNQMPELMQHVIIPSVAAPQRQDPPSYQDPRTVKPIELQRNPTPQVAERPVALTVIHQQVSNVRRNNPRKDLLAKLSFTPMKCIDKCADPATCSDSETQSKVPEKIVYQHPESKKLVADQATEMESNECQDSGTQSSLESTESGYETYKHPTNVQESQEVPDSEMVYDAELSNNVSTDSSDSANENYSEEDTMSGSTDVRLMDVHSLVLNIQEKLSEIAEEERMEVHSLLLPKMYNTFVNTEEYFNNLRISTMGCVKLYETLLNKEEMMEVHGLLLAKMYKTFVNTQKYCNNLRISTLGWLKLYETLSNKTQKLMVVESHTNPTSKEPEVPRVQKTPAPTPVQVSVPVSVPVPVPKPAPVQVSVPVSVPVPVPKPAPEPEQNPTTSDQNNDSSVKNSPKKSKRRHTFVLPPEYDSKDSRWTLKHREPGPKLMELMPRSRVYVSINEYNKCIRTSNDCRTLARSLLTAVFNKNALSVCSLTGAKARAFNNVKIDTRPGLDEDSRLALLAFIDKYGEERKWNTSDTAGIMSSIRTKIQDMRNKYGKTKVV